MSRQTADDFRLLGAPLALRLRGLVRRVVVSLTDAAGGAWQALGYQGADGDREQWNNVELFQGVGVHARPKATGKVEAIILNVGADEEHPVIIATRDRSLQVALDEDETTLVTSKGSVKITKDGDIIVRAAAGRTIQCDDGSGAAPLATKADIDDLKTYVAGHTHPVPGITAGGASTTSAPPASGPPSAAGTLVLKGK